MRTAISFAALAAALTFAAPAVAQTGTYRGTLAQCGDGQRLQLRAGQRYIISASADFDTVLRILRSGSSDVLAQDDDGGDGTNSRLTFAPTETGTYIACVTAYASSGSGAYTLTVENAPPLPPPATRPTSTESATWQVYDGTLTSNDPTDDGAPFDDYQIQIPDGHRAIISLESAAFDTVLKVYAANERGAEPAASDDDGGGGLNSFLTFAPEHGGTFIVRATSYGSGGTGAYRLRVMTSPVPARSEPSYDDASDAE